jgi:hypothetical protein
MRGHLRSGMRSARRFAVLPIAPQRNLRRKTTTVMFVTKLKDVNRSRGEAAETIHHLYMAKEKGYMNLDVYNSFRGRYKECIRMLNGLEKTLERKLPEGERRWAVREQSDSYSVRGELDDVGWPQTIRTLTPEP